MSKLPLRIAWRADTEPHPWIVSLWRKGKQICSITPSKLMFSDPADYNTDKTFDQNAVSEEVMITLGKAYEKAELQNAETATIQICTASVTRSSRGWDTN